MTLQLLQLLQVTFGSFPMSWPTRESFKSDLQYLQYLQHARASALCFSLRPLRHTAPREALAQSEHGGSSANTQLVRRG
jgi:hypothetical protein